MKVRFRFVRLGKVRWTSHRDVARMWERALRRLQLPVAYSAGFTPRPKVSFGLALPTGHESVAEYLDVEFLDVEDLNVPTLPARLSASLPVGIDVTAAIVLVGPADSLQEQVTSCTWELETVGASLDEIRCLVDQALKAESLVITRQRKGVDVTDDVRPAILSVEVHGPVECDTEGHTPGAVLVAELATQPRSLRPAEFIAALSPGLREGHVRRTHQWSTRDGARREPIPLDATDAPHAEVRAS
jgi:radical SAM-linked protein